MEDIDTINNLCLKEPSKHLTTHYLFYTNKKMMAHNAQLFLNASEPTFFFEIIDIWHHSLPTSYLIPTNPNKIIRLHKTIKIKIVCL
jgi:hypothetical protein